MPINPGDLRHRVKVEVGTPSQNALGEPVVTWAIEQERWAGIKPLVGTELFKARQVHNEVTHQVRLRWYEGLSPSRRIKMGDRIFEIVSAVNVEERREETLCLCKEHVNG